MGLDIVSWRNLVEAPEPAEWDGAHIHVTASPHFPGRTDGLADGWYTGERGVEFKAGSYSGYGEWREWLARLAGYALAPHPQTGAASRAAGAWAASGGPFWELIEFYDNEGEIGPIVSAKLARDFAEFDARAKAASLDGWQYERFCLWRRAFEWAAEGGCVEFC